MNRPPPFSALAFACLAALPVACSYIQAPARGPEATCVDACHARAPRCSDVECARGCNLVIDRLVENEGDAVLACVARVEGPCVDRRWAACAARVGPHADGGPPPPPPPHDFEDTE